MSSSSVQVGEFLILLISLLLITGHNLQADKLTEQISLLNTNTPD